jgi:succinoglycan biosynthesis protein ExoO
MAVFSSIAMRGAWRIGPFLVARDPRILLRAAAGLVKRSLNPPAPYAIGLPISRADQVFVARHARGPTAAVIADYAFLTDLIAYAPAAPSLVVMHDLFSSRAAQFDRVGSRDSTADISEAAEMAMLSLADCVVAIQPQEAAIVARRLPSTRVLTAPMAVRPVAAPQPGDGGLLFVGSAAAPNVDGLRWFLDDIWPILCRGTVLTVAGAAGRAVGAVPEGVTVAGRVEDLTEAYRAAAVVISPLRAGSGLKIKLIEALGHGKAIVATRVTVQGVEALTQDAVLLADDAAGFARAITVLLRDPALRVQHGEAALKAAREHFSAAACYGEVIAQITTPERNIIHQQ